MGYLWRICDRFPMPNAGAVACREHNAVSKPRADLFVQQYHDHPHRHRSVHSPGRNDVGSPDLNTKKDHCHGALRHATHRSDHHDTRARPRTIHVWRLRRCYMASCLNGDLGSNCPRSLSNHSLHPQSQRRNRQSTRLYCSRSHKHSLRTQRQRQRNRSRNDSPIRLTNETNIQAGQRFRKCSTKAFKTKA